MLPDCRPRSCQEVTQGFIVRLTGDDLTIRFDAHVVIGSGAALYAEVKLKRVKVAVLGGGVPDQALTAFLGEISRHFKQFWQILLFETGVDGAALA